MAAGIGNTFFVVNLWRKTGEIIDNYEIIEKIDKQNWLKTNLTSVFFFFFFFAILPIFWAILFKGFRVSSDAVPIEKFLIFEIFPSIFFFYDLLLLGPLPPLKPPVSHGSPIIVLHRKSRKNWRKLDFRWWPPDLNAELGRLCPFSAPGGHTFSTCPPRFPPRVFHGQIFTPDKHKVSAPNAPRPKVIQIIRPWKNWRDLKKLTFNTLLLH